MTNKKDLLTINFTPDGIKEHRGIVMHSMWGTYTGSIAWFKNPSSKASAHYLISENGEITQMVEEKDMAWHAGIIDDVAPDWVLPNPNWYTIGIELEDKRDPNWQYPEAQRKAASELVSAIKNRYKIPNDKIMLHKQLNPSRRSDPVGNFSFEWLLKLQYDTDSEDMKRAVDLLEGFKKEHNHGNYEGAMRSLLGTYGDHQSCESDKENAVKQAIAERDEYWQSELESANKALKECQEKKCEDLTWKELLILAIKRFPN